MGKKGEISYAFTSLCSERLYYDELLDDGILVDNIIKGKEINDDEFDELHNLKNAETILNYKDLLKCFEKNNLKYQKFDYNSLKKEKQ